VNLLDLNGKSSFAICVDWLPSLLFVQDLVLEFCSPEFWLLVLEFCASNSFFLAVSFFS
jgi:hypothetical protein